MTKPKILFVCTGNSARSQMAEALMKYVAGDVVEVHSAGTEPKEINPLTTRVMNEIGVSMEGQYPKSVKEFLGRHSPTHVIFVCQAAEEACPRIWPFALQTESWSLDDPAAAPGSEAARIAAFREIRDEIRGSVQEWIETHNDALQV